MELTVTDKAAHWFKEHVGLPENKKDMGIRFKTKIYGSSPVRSSFALAIEANNPIHPIAEFKSDDGLNFFVEESDEWFFDEHDLQVDYDEELDEPKYIYLKDGEAIN